MAVKIKVKSPAMTAARLEKVFYEKALPIVAEQIKTDCNVFAREQSGELIRNTFIEKGGKEIVWRTGYAKRVYYTGTPLKNKNPNASLRWCEKAKREYAKDWAAEATKLVNR